MIERAISPITRQLLTEYPAVTLLGPRQVGKTTLAKEIAAQFDAIYLDLETASDLRKLEDPELYLSRHEKRLVILDEIQRSPELFRCLRGLIDTGKERGIRSGRFLLLGSASLDLLQQSSESLAGRIAYLEMSPLTVGETGETVQNWVRGGFPDSYLAASNTASMRWRRNFIRTYIERDIPQLGPRIPSETLRRFWGMLAHHHSGVHNAASLARALDVDGKTIAAYLDLFVDLLLVRKLEPWHRNAGKRLVKSPKIYIRDSGILHALLGITDFDSLLGSPASGGSWEGFVIENILEATGENVEASFYRTSAGAEIDLVLKMPSGEVLAVEIKKSLSPKLSKGYHNAFEDIGAGKGFLVYSGEERYPVTKTTEAISLTDLCKTLQESRDA